jgi:uncharacterized protein YxeA
MGIRIEIVLFIAIVVIITGSLTIKLNNDANKQKPFTKELEFTYTTFTEVNTEKLLGRAYSTYGMRDDGVLTMNHLTYQADNIESLVANKGTYMGDIIYLEGDVVMDDTNGYVYETQQAEYNQETEILNITAPFVATRDKDIIKGDTFTYNTRSKEAYGTKIDAVIYTIEK